MARKAARMPTEEASFRWLFLNQSDRRQRAVRGPRRMEGMRRYGCRYIRWPAGFGRLDLSEVSDLTSLVLMAPKDGVWNIRADILAARRRATRKGPRPTACHTMCGTGRIGAGRRRSRPLRAHGRLRVCRGASARAVRRAGYPARLPSTEWNTAAPQAVASEGRLYRGTG